MNAGTIVVLCILTAVVLTVILVMRNDRKKGKKCCGSCVGCSQKNICKNTNQDLIR